MEKSNLNSSLDKNSIHSLSLDTSSFEITEQNEHETQNESAETLNESLKTRDVQEETGFIHLQHEKQEQQIFYRLWRPTTIDAQVIGILHINHGMAEHSGRYKHFAHRCVQAGYIVIAQDHPGHGESIDSPEYLGHFGDKDGWKYVMKGIASTQGFLQQHFSGLPFYFFGHSMGSFATLSYLEQIFIKSPPLTKGLQLKGVILSGSTQNPWYLNRSLQIIAGLETWRQGDLGKSSLLHMLTFRSYNNRFKPTRTSADWLSRDPQAVDRYINDPLCGQQSTNKSCKDLAQGLIQTFKKRHLKKLPRVPFLLISGDQDPLSDQGGFHRLEESLKKAGIPWLEARTFPHGRHELLNEINHEEVEALVFDWLKRVQNQSNDR